MLRCVLALAAAFLLASPAAAQVQRSFPQNALRGAIVFGAAPEIAVNGQRARLAPGARIRDANNMSSCPRPSTAASSWCTTRSTPPALVKDVWILTPEEAAKKPWPTTPEQSPDLAVRSDRADLGQAVTKVASAKPKVFIKTFGCQMNEYDSDKMADVLHAAAGLRADRRRRAGRPDPVQHLLGAREGAGEGVQRPRPRQAPEGTRAC